MKPTRNFNLQWYKCWNYYWIIIFFFCFSAQITQQNLIVSRQKYNKIQKSRNIDYNGGFLNMLYFWKNKGDLTSDSLPRDSLGENKAKTLAHYYLGAAFLMKTQGAQTMYQWSLKIWACNTRRFPCDHDLRWVQLIEYFFE